MEPIDEERVTINGEGQRSRKRASPAITNPLAVGIILATAILLAFSGLFSGPSQPSQPTASPTTTSNATTTTTLSNTERAALEYEADVVLITQLWADQTQAWATGFDDGVAFWVGNNYPDMGCSLDDYMRAWFPDGPVDGFKIERIPDPNTIEADEGWIIPGGKLQGLAAQGRVYVMEVSDSFTNPLADPAPTQIRRFHVTIIDGRAHFFIGCQ